MKYIAYEQDSILKTATILDDDIDGFVSENNITECIEFNKDDLDLIIGNGSLDNCAISNGQLVQDMQRNLDSKLEKIRIDREEKLKELDVDFLRLLETNSDTDSIVAQKNALRDLPATVSAMKFNSVDELIAYWPDELS